MEQVIVSSLLYLAIKKLLLQKKHYNLASLAILIYLYYVISTHIEVQELNAYQKLDLPRTSTSEEIKDSYKRMLKFKHPDKDPSPTAEQDFLIYKSLYDLIKTPESRIKYERFGQNNELEALAGSTIFYTSWIFVACGMFLSKNSNPGRNLLCVISAIGLFEAWIFPNFLIYGIFWPNFTVFEVLGLFKILTPVISLLINSIEYIRVQEGEEKFNMKYKELVEDKAKDIIENIITKTNPAEIIEFVSRLQREFEKKYERNWKKDALPFLILAYLIFR